MTIKSIILTVHEAMEFTFKPSGASFRGAEQMAQNAVRKAVYEAEMAEDGNPHKAHFGPFSAISWLDKYGESCELTYRPKGRKPVSRDIYEVIF